MQPLLLSCRRCSAPIDPGARAGLAGAGRVLVDAACGSCGTRALYELPRRPVALGPAAGG